MPLMASIGGHTLHNIFSVLLTWISVVSFQHQFWQESVSYCHVTIGTKSVYGLTQLHIVA